MKPEAHADPDTAATNSDSSPEPLKEKRIEGPVPSTAEAAESAMPKAEAEAEVVKAVADAEPVNDNNKSETEETEPQVPGEEGHSAGPADVEQQMSNPQQSAFDETEPERTKHASEEKAANKARQPPPPPPRHPGPVVRPVSTQCAGAASQAQEKSAHSHGKFDKPEEPGFAPDGTPYVGDGTWEERTWKELTRLREDAFWARVGKAQ